MFVIWTGGSPEAGAAGLAPGVQLNPLEGRGVCMDGNLSITFAQPPVLGTSGAIHVFSDNGTLVDDIDLAALNCAANSPLLNSDRRNFGGAVSDNGNVHQFNGSIAIRV
jgi:hypothetical protein